MSGFQTRAVHVAFHKKDPYGALNFPVYDTAAYEFDSAAEMEAVFSGKKPGFAYTRNGNPSVDFFERKLKNITSAPFAAAFASGMAAISCALLSICAKGDTIVASPYLFGHSYSLLVTTFERFGIDVKLVDFCDLEAVENAIDERTRVLFFETIANPQLDVADIAALHKMAKKRDVVLAADTTMTPPYLLDAKALGIDVEIFSTTKFFSGGATSVGGAVLDYGTFDWSKIPLLTPLAKTMGPGAFFARIKKEIGRNFGSVMSPHNAYLQSLGTETVALRAERACSNALTLAKHLHSCNVHVCYPGLESNPFYALAKQQFRYPGSVLTIDFADKKECFAFMDALRLARRATNICDNKTLVIHPHSMIYTDFTDEQKKEMRIGIGTLRVSVGIEDIDDIVADFDAALKQL